MCILTVIFQCVLCAFILLFGAFVVFIFFIYRALIWTYLIECLIVSAFSDFQPYITVLIIARIDALRA